MNGLVVIDIPLIPRTTTPSLPSPKTSTLTAPHIVMLLTCGFPVIQAGRIGSGRFDRGDSLEERKRGDGPGITGSLFDVHQTWLDLCRIERPGPSRDLSPMGRRFHGYCVLVILLGNYCPSIVL